MGCGENTRNFVLQDRKCIIKGCNEFGVKINKDARQWILNIG